MMNRNIVVIALVLSLVCLSSKAQVRKQVEVTKSYVPEVDTPTKLRLEPDMVDTVQLRPEIDYSITPRSVETNLSPRLYKPATVTYWEFNRPERGYLKAAIGVPVATAVDIYVSNSNPNTNYFIGYINHEGQYGKVTNNYDQRVSALNTQNRLGAAAGIVIAERALEGEFYYDVDAWSRSATAAPSVARPLYQTLCIGGRYGDEFIDLSKFNYNITLNASNFFNREGDSNTAINVGAKVGRDLKSGQFISSVGYDCIGGSGDYLNNSLLLGILYSSKAGSWDWGIGADFYSDVVSMGGVRNTKTYLLPHFTLKNSSNVGFRPFFEIDGDLYRYNYGALTAINPYVLEGVAMAVNSVDYSMRGGFSGLLKGGKLSYNIFADYTVTSNALYWTLYEVQSAEGEYDNYYVAEQGTLQGLSLNFDFEYRPLGDLTFKAGGSATKYMKSDAVSAALGRPYAELYLGGEYKRGALSCGLMFDIKGVSYTSQVVVSTLLSGEGESATVESIVEHNAVQIPVTVNLKPFVEYTFKNDIKLFLEANNFANSKQYEWMGYREYGVSIMVGVKRQF